MRRAPFCGDIGVTKRRFDSRLVIPSSQVLIRLPDNLTFNRAIRGFLCFPICMYPGQGHQGGVVLMIRAIGVRCYPATGPSYVIDQFIGTRQSDRSFCELFATTGVPFHVCRRERSPSLAARSQPPPLTSENNLEHLTSRSGRLFTHIPPKIKTDFQVMPEYSQTSCYSSGRWVSFSHVDNLHWPASPQSFLPLWHHVAGNRN